LGANTKSEFFELNFIGNQAIIRVFRAGVYNLFAIASRITFIYEIQSPISSTYIYEILPVLPLCCYGKVLDFMIKKTLDYKKHWITKTN